MFEFLVTVVFEGLFLTSAQATGHAAIWILTFGRRPWAAINDDLAVIVGFLVWIAVAVAVWLAFFR